MLNCKDAEKMVLSYINYQLEEMELEAFLNHIKTCHSCKEELEIYYMATYGLRQLDSGTGFYDITGALEESLDTAWLKVKTVKLRKIIYYAVNTLCVVGVLTTLILQLRIWLHS
ncbi:MAG: zf-HC2 domain-containing protein [Lachnospiraceae bacterium]